MKKLYSVFILFCLSLSLFGQSTDRIKSSVDTLDNNRLLLTQSFSVNAPLDKVWNAYTTEEGWTKWSSPLAEINLQKGGTILTNYNPKGEIGDSTTITLHILDLEYQAMLKLQAEISVNFPEFMQEDEKELYNVITFHKLDSQNTKVISKGFGYRNNVQYLSLMEFFIKGNEQLLMGLIDYLETE